MKEDKIDQNVTESESETKTERGFNDDELADIMSEIETLEKEFSEDVIALEVKKELDQEKVDETTSNDSASIEDEVSDSVSNESLVDSEDIKQVDSPDSDIEEAVVSEEESIAPQESPIEINSKSESPSEGVSVEEEKVEDVVAVNLETDIASIEAESSAESPDVNMDSSPDSEIEKTISEIKQDENISAKEESQTFPADSESKSNLSDELNNFEVPKKEHNHRSSNVNDVSELHHYRIDDQHPPSKIKGSKPMNGSKNKMTFSLTGDMILNLEFICGDKVIELEVDQDSFSVKLDNGMSLYLPFEEGSKKKAS
jgi:hypothetical protein